MSETLVGCIFILEAEQQVDGTREFCNVERANWAGSFAAGAFGAAPI